MKRDTNWFLTLDSNVTRTDLDLFDSTIDKKTVGVRAGWRGDVGRMKWSGWLGTMYVDDRTVIEGTALTGTALDPIKYQVATVFDKPWNFLVGSMLEVTNSIHLMAELGFGDREQFTLVASYRF